MRDPNGESPLDQAAKRLERAVAQLEARMRERGAEPQTNVLFGEDRAQLAIELDKARAREKELEAAGAEASAALGRAIAEIRKALNGQAQEA